ncbi:MAG: SIS domain-containing protein [Acidobacteria bacterium]|nr:SIS domain-containing protein [Acidobacteriota bacterium]
MTSLQATLSSIDLQTVTQAAAMMAECRQAGRTIFVLGNGGSMATASHFVCDVVKGASYGRESRFKMMCLLDNGPTVTAYANDVGYEDALVEQMKNFAAPGDLVIAISGSGRSPNVVKAIAWSKENGCQTMSMTGRDGGLLLPMTDCAIHVSEQHMGRIEDAHMVVCHMLSYLFMEQVN